MRKPISAVAAVLVLTVACWIPAMPASAQRPPSEADIAGYRGLHAAAHDGDVAAIHRIAAEFRKYWDLDCPLNRREDFKKISFATPTKWRQLTA